jgi:dihydrofolate reductase
MARLIYSNIQSLDGYIADEDGKFDWAEPDEEVHTFANDLERSVVADAAMPVAAAVGEAA